MGMNPFPARSVASSPRRLKVAATALALVPALLFGAFAVGEGSGGWPHLVQLALILCGLAAAWRVPRVAGYAMLALGLIAGILYLIWPPAALPLYAYILVEVVVFAPIAASGYLFTHAAPRASDPVPNA